MTSPAISVIIPVYNREALVTEAIGSALRAAEGLDVEIIVVDDASTDGTWRVLQSYDDPRVRPLRLERNGRAGAARNHGLDAARGPFVKFLDSDDVLMEGHLALEADALAGGADIAVSGWCEEDLDGRLRCTDAPVFGSIPDDILAGKAVPTSGALYRIRKHWRFETALQKLDDWDYFVQAALDGARIVTVPGPAYVWKHHAGPRVTDVPMLLNALEHHRILKRIEDRLTRDGLLNEARTKRLAQYYYKELRILSLHDRPSFLSALEHIQELDPDFHPGLEERQRFMRVLVSILGVRATLTIHSAIKRAVLGLRSRVR